MKQPKEFQEAKETLATYMVTEIASKYIRADSTAEGKSKMNYWYKQALNEIEIAITDYKIQAYLSSHGVTNYPNTPMATKKKKVVAKKATPKKKVVVKKKK